MGVEELTRDQMVQLKMETILKENQDNGETTSWEELVRADELVTDEKVRERYAGTAFVPEDFG